MEMTTIGFIRHGVTTWNKVNLQLVGGFPPSPTDC